MPVGYLVTVAFVAWCTLHALAPLRRPRRLAVLSWISGMVVNELPFVAFAFLLGSTLLAIAEGDVDSPGGPAIVGVAGVTAVGLGILVRRSSRTAPALEAAMREGLGPGWRGALEAETGSAPGRRPPWARILLAPLPVRPRAVERVANIRYGDAGARNLLDLYRHRSHQSGGPVLVHLHGGRFRRGAKSREARPLLHRLATRGWVCVSANYRLSPAVQFPEHLIDVKKVIAWVREHGDEHGADASVVFVAGSSAGAHLAALAALTSDDPSFQPGFEHVDTSVAAAIGLYGWYGPLVTGAAVPSSPSDYVRPDAPPFLVAHGDLDTYVPVASARRFVERLRGVASRPVVYAELPGAQHSFDLFHSIRFEAVVDGIEAFAAWVLSTQVRTRRP